MSTDAWWTIRQALVEYRDKDFSSATNDQIHAMTDALAADLESQIAEQQPAPVSATEPEAVMALRNHVEDGNESLYSGRQRVVCDAVELLAYIDSFSAIPPKVRKSGRKDPMVLCKSCQHMIDNDEWHDCPELNKKLVKTLEQENTTLRARVAELERERDDVIACARGTSMDDAAIHSMRKYIVEKIKIEDERNEYAARITELERVTEEQVERACAKMWGAENWSGYNLFEKDAMRAKMRAALTAARGGG